VTTWSQVCWRKMDAVTTEQKYNFYSVLLLYATICRRRVAFWRIEITADAIFPCFVYAKFKTIFSLHKKSVMTMNLPNIKIDVAFRIVQIIPYKFLKVTIHCVRFVNRYN
jgi:hypothetical protein